MRLINNIYCEQYDETKKVVLIFVTITVVVDIVNGSTACQAQLRKWTVNSKVYRRKLPLVLRKNVDECT